MSSKAKVPTKNFQRSLGLGLAGVKNDRSALAVLDYYPSTRRLILVDIVSGFQELSEDHADDVLVDEIVSRSRETKNFAGLCVHGPLSWPPFFRGPSGRAETLWLQRSWESLDKPRPRRFLPYLQRASEVYWRYMAHETFDVPDGLGANWAPVAARLSYLKKQLPQKIIESFPRAIMSRLVKALDLNKNWYKSYTDFTKGYEVRENFVSKLCKKCPQIFVYERDIEKMLSNLSYFNAFLLALNQHCCRAQQCEKPPRDFPKGAQWLSFPKEQIDWKKVFYE